MTHIHHSLRAMAAAFFTVMALAVAAPAAAQSVEAVTSVRTPSGEFVQLANGQWQERGQNGGRFNFVETNRDDHAIYLFDTSRTVRLSLDLGSRQIMYGDASAPDMRPIYQIAGIGTVVNGWNASRASYAQGAFRLIAPGQWVEKGNNGAVFNFTEVARDDWSVYLVDRSRNVEIQLDFFTRKIMYNQSGQPRSPLYDITSSSARYQ